MTAGARAPRPVRRVVHLTLRAFDLDSRMRKEIAAVLGADPRVRVAVVAWSETLPRYEVIGPRAEVHRLRLSSARLPNRFGGRLPKYAEWLVRACGRVRALRPDVVHVHGVSTLPAGVLLRELTGARLVYDAHELETEAMGMHGLRQGLAKVAEHLLMRRVDAMLVVSESIRGWYAAHRPAVPLELVRNVPWREDPGTAAGAGVVRKGAAPEPAVPGHRAPTAPERSFRRRFGLPDQALVFLLHGLLGPGRGVEALLDLFRDRRDHRHLVLMGYGPLAAPVRDLAGIASNIHYMPAVPHAELADWVRGADVGIHLLEARCLNNDYALPNKFFECLLAGVPMITRPLTELRRLVEAYDCGWTVADDAAARRLIDALDREAVAARGPGVAAFRAAMAWEHEIPALLRATGLAAAPAATGAPARGVGAEAA